MPPVGDDAASAKLHDDLNTNQQNSMEVIPQYEPLPHNRRAVSRHAVIIHFPSRIKT
jgi:hypothetical protein